jgi:hypothetical protein
MKTVQAKWIRFDEQTNALDYLEKCFSFLKTVEYEPQNGNGLSLRFIVPFMGLLFLPVKV